MGSRFLTVVLGVAGMVFLAAFAWQLMADVFKVVSDEKELPLSERLAAEGLAQVPERIPTPEALQVASEKGWFPALRQPIFSWEDSLDGWEIDEAQAGNATNVEPLPPLRPNAVHASEGKYSLEIPVRFPDPITVFCKARYLRGVRFIAYDVFLPAEAKGYIGCLFFLKDKDGRWYQARSRAPLRPGRWTTVTADIRGGSPDVEPLGHTGQWDENQASQVIRIGLTLYGDEKFHGSVFLDRFRGWMRADRFLLETRPDRLAALADEKGAELQPFVELAQTRPGETLRFLNLRTEPATNWSRPESMPQLALYSSFIARFDLNRTIRNPFDPSQADVWAEIVTPSNRTIKVPAFWYQDFERRLRFAAEQLVPVGRPEWRLRFTPHEEGIHRIRLNATLERGTDLQEEASGPEFRFLAVPGNSRGFLRVSKANRYFFEFDNGEFFYPIGHNVHTPIDMRCWSRIFSTDPPIPRGLTMYEDIFPKMAANGENVAEVWMASWWVGIEWTRRWPHYHGAGRYSLERAWLLDQLFDLARDNGMLIHLVIDNHGKFSTWCDEEWAWNPYDRREPGGWLDGPDAFFTDRRAREMHNRRLRYIAARWAGETEILGWEIVSEYDLTGERPGPQGSPGHRSSTGHKWARETAQFLRDSDPYAHPITNHYSGNYARVDLPLMRNPEFDYIVGDGYRGEGSYSKLAMITNSHFRNAVNKPFWITEYGGNWSATTPPRLHSDLHTGMWSTWMTDGAGTPLFWWYDFIDRYELYSHYRGFANYIKGEDRRKIRGKTLRLTLGSHEEVLQGMQYKWDHGAYAWICDRGAAVVWPEKGSFPKFEDVNVNITSLAPGNYRVEFWNTLSGEIIGTQNHELKYRGNITLSLPPFEVDIAIKVKCPEDPSATRPARSEPDTSVVPGDAPPRFPKKR